MQKYYTYDEAIAHCDDTVSRAKMELREELKQYKVIHTEKVYA